MFIRKLTFSNFRYRRSRVALTVAAVALSVSLVVAVTSGYSSLFEAAFQYLNRYMGTTDAHISRTADPIGGVPWKLIEDLRKDPDVRRVDGRMTVPWSLKIQDPKAPGTVFKQFNLVGIDRPDDKRVDRLTMEGGAWFDTTDEHSAVVDQVLAGLLDKKLGDTITLTNASQKELTLKVVGIVHKPAVLAVHISTMYLPLHTLQTFIHQEGRASEAMIDLTNQADHKVFEQRWKERLPAYDPNLKFRLSTEVRSQMDADLQGIQLLSYMGGAVSMLAATFIIFSALSMGVSERQRSLAMLRAVGAVKSQIAGLVVFEGIILASIGMAIGVALGWVWIKTLTLLFKDVFTAGVALSGGGLLLGTVGTLVTALAASLLPAWTATRVSPLEAMSPLSHSPTYRAPLGWAAIGLVLASIDPSLFHGPLDWLMRAIGVANPAVAARELKFRLHFMIGLPSLFIGYFLIAPLCVWIIERVAGPIVSRMFGLRFALLRQQLSGGIWRAAGTGAALMVGLSVLVVMQVSGHTMLGGWRLPDKFPDVFIGTTGLSKEEEAQLAKTPGLNELMPIEIASTSLGGLGGSPFAVAGSILLPDSIMWIGIDPNKAFHMMKLDFREGNEQDAERLLKQGNWVIVTQEYRQVSGRKVGDTITLGGHEFHIAGVVWSPGIDVMVGMYDMGDQFEQRTVSSVFGSIADGEKYFGARPYIFAADLQPGLERVDLIKRIKEHLRAEGLQVGDVREIKFKIETGFYRLLYMLSSVAFAAMAVASLGVTNTIMAAIRSRRWQFGILRSIGVTRGQLMRLVLAEAMLLGLIGCVLGLGAGFEMSFDANALAAAMLGYKPPLVIPIWILCVGVAAVITISLVASIWPATEAARTEPLLLLQAGRAAM